MPVNTMAEQNEPPSDERTPLLGGTCTSTSELGQDNSSRNGHDDASVDQQVITWRRRRWISLIVSTFLIIAFVAIFILFGVLSRVQKKPSKMASSICLTPSCIHAASEILYNLSPDYQKIDPCTNFDQLVCDGFDARHDIAQDASSTSTFSAMTDNAMSTLRHILESPYPTTSEHSTFSPRNLAKRAASTDEDNFKVMQQAYNSCMNETVLEKIGVAPLVSQIDRVAKSFPVSETDYGADTPLGETDYASLSDTILLLQQLGVTAFENLGTGPDDKDPDVVIIQAAPPELTLPSLGLYQDDEVLSLYQKMLGEVFSTLLPTNSSKAAASRLAQAVVEIEKKIAAVTPSPDDQSDVTKYYNIVNVDEIGKLGPAFQLDSVIRALAPKNYTVDRMLLAFPEYLGNVSEIVSQSPKAAVQSYLIWQLINGYSAYVEGPEVEAIGQFTNVLSGKDASSSTERWKTCVTYADSSVGWYLSRFYVETAFSEEAKNLGDQVIMDIKQQFISKLNGLSWMDDSVKKLAVNKVNKIDQKIGYPTTSPNITNPDAVRASYNGLEITDSFFNNTLSSNKFTLNKTWSALGKPVDRGQWLMSADTVNAYYNPVGNEIVFPAGIMQFPSFAVDLPSYVSYGAFASVAGHELSHAFDDSGRHYDENGNYTNWWNNNTVDEFQKRADCFVDQYSNFTVEGNNGSALHVNGQLTLGENIADAGGLSASFGAWKQRQETHPDQNLPGLDFFNQDQLFFVFYANWWCDKSRQAKIINAISTDPHSPAFARILGPTANSRAFRETFNCPAKEPTCELW
ncbi:endothelin-converting enzyme 1 [Xylariaceae sp. FL0662B]|nr:endothelin-converting enzyme 1 [Xylariaceae sp. FL0662B]